MTALNPDHVKNALEMAHEYPRSVLTISAVEDAGDCTGCGDGPHYIVRYADTSDVDDITIDHPFLFSIIKGLDEEQRKDYFIHLIVEIDTGWIDAADPLFYLLIHTASIPDILAALWEVNHG